MQDDFHYTETGLLDETHVHLFGEKNYYRLIREAGLHICREDRVYLDTGETEQCPSKAGIPEEVRQYLSLRKNGEVYQFVADLTEDGGDTVWDNGDGKDAPRLLSERQQIAKLEREIREIQDYAHQLEGDRGDRMANVEKLEREIREIQDYAHQLENNNRELIAGNKKLEKELSHRTESYRKEIRDLKNTQKDERIQYEAEIAKYRRELKRKSPEQG
jgi:DNA repair exonuclease SbcCD ATPase subunit